MRLPRWLVSAVLAFQLLLSLLQLLDAHRVWYFPMIRGSAYYLQFDLGFSLVPALLPVSFLVLICLLKNGRYREVVVAVTISVGFYLLFGVEAAVAWLSVFQVVLALWHLVGIGEFFFWFLVFLTGFEVIALVHWALLPFGMVTPLAWFADLELTLFYILAPLAPLVVLAIILIVILKLLAPQYLIIAGRFFRVLYSSGSKSDEGEIRLNPKMFLVASVALSVVAALYPYSRNINPNGITFGVDVHYYLDWMGPVTQDLSSAFTVANGSRPVVLLLIYGVQQGLGLKLLDAIKYLPVLLNPLLVLSVYFMVSQATGDQEWAGLTSLITVSGFKITVGMYAYFLTNMLGLSLIFLALGFLFRAMRTENVSDLILALLSGSLAVFTHPWTYIQYYAATAFFLGYRYFKKNVSEGSSTVFIYLGLVGLVDLFKGVVVRGLEGVGSIISLMPMLVDVVNFWSNNVFIFRLKYGGLLSNTVLLVLVALGAYMLKDDDDFKLFLISLLATSSFFYFIAYEEVISRLLYNIPFGILSALGIIYLLRNNYLDRKIIFIFLFFSITYMIIYLLRSVANLL